MSWVSFTSWREEMNQRPRGGMIKGQQCRMRERIHGAAIKRVMTLRHAASL